MSDAVPTSIASPETQLSPDGTDCAAGFPRQGGTAARAWPFANPRGFCQPAGGCHWQKNGNGKKLAWWQLEIFTSFGKSRSFGKFPKSRGFLTGAATRAAGAPKTTRGAYLSQRRGPRARVRQVRDDAYIVSIRAIHARAWPASTCSASGTAQTLHVVSV